MTDQRLSSLSADPARVDRLAAFSLGDEGGNPAGVSVLKEMPDAATMQKVAADIGFSETVFLAPVSAKADGFEPSNGFQARYFAPEMEVPFCGHATIAAGAALGMRFGAGDYPLSIASGEISVEAKDEGGRWSATLVSPPSWWRPARSELAQGAMRLFGLEKADLAPGVEICEAGAGASHLFLTLATRDCLASLGRGEPLRYDLEGGRELMGAFDIVTIALLWAEAPRVFHVRNAFAAGGVAEDPATGAAAAAFCGMLHAQGRVGAGESVVLEQGRDMACPSLIEVEAPNEVGGSLRVSGAVRKMPA